MNQLSIDAENIYAFRYVRHMLGYGMPPCCIVFAWRFIECAPWFSERLMDKLTDPDASGLKHQLAAMQIDRVGYYDLIYDRYEHKLHYTPCPACALSGNVFDIPKGCPCCSDSAQYPLAA
jgi:hypothetical protein